MKSLFPDSGDERLTFIAKKDVKVFLFLGLGHSDGWVFINVLIDNVVRKNNFLKSLGTSDNNLPSRKDTRRDFFHLFRGFEFDFHGRIPVWFKRHFEKSVMFFKVIGHHHEIDIVIETEIGINHDDTKRIW